MNIFKFIFSKTFLLQILLAVVLVVGLCFGYLYWLESYTNHNETIQVPDLNKKDLTRSRQLIQEAELTMEILDSAAYNPDYPPKSVIWQHPFAGNDVKEDRKIYVKLNPSGYGELVVPDVVYRTRRQAVPQLKAMGFNIGEITYKPNLAKDMVLEMRHKGEKLEPGKTLKKTAVIDLVLGDGKRDD